MTITLAQWLNLGVNTLLPIVVAVVTARVAHPGVKAVTLLVLSAISGFGVSWLDTVNAGAPFDASQAGFTAVTGFIIAVASHFGLWKPAAVTGSQGRVASALPRGIGAPRY